MATAKKLLFTLAALASFAHAKDPLRNLADKIHDATATPVESSATVEASTNADTAAHVETLGYHGKCDLRYYGEKGVGPLHTHVFQYDLHLDQDPYAFDAKVSLKNHGDKKAKHVKVKFYASLDKNFGPHDRAHGFLGKVTGRVDAHELKEFKYTNAHADWGEGVRYIIAAWKSECTHGYTWVVIGKVKIKKHLKCELKARGEKGVALLHAHDFKYDIHLDTHPYKFDAKLTLFNHGNKKTEHVKVKFYASLDKNFGPHDQAHGYLGEVSAGHIQPHDSYEFKHGAVADWGHGKRYVIAVWESDCTHGQAWKVIGKVKVKNPCKCELVAYGEKGLAKVHDEHNFQYSLSLKAHDPFTAKVTLSNHGCKKAEHVKVKFYASLDKNFGPHDKAHGFLGEDYGFVHPHSSTEFKKVLSANWGHGVRYIIAAWTSECKHGETWVVLGKAKPSNWVQSP